MTGVQPRPLRYQGRLNRRGRKRTVAAICHRLNAQFRRNPITWEAGAR